MNVPPVSSTPPTAGSAMPMIPQLPAQMLNWPQELGQFGDSLVSELLRRVFCKPTSSNSNSSDLPDVDPRHWWEEIPFLEQYRRDAHFRWELIRSVLRGDNRGKLNAKLLAIVCWTAPTKEDVAKLFGRFIYAARDDKELTNFVSLALAVLPQLVQDQAEQQAISSGEPGVMSASVLHALTHAAHIYEECTKFEAETAPMSGEAMNPVEKEPELPDGQVVHNIYTLLRWQQEAPELNSLRHLGISLPDLRGSLQDALLAWALDFVARIDRKRELLEHEGTLHILDAFFALMRLAVPQVQLPLCYHNRLLAKLCALIVAFLRLVDKGRWGTSADGVDFVCRCFAISGKIFTAQIGASKTQLLGALIDEVFGNADELFNDGSADPSSSTIAGGDSREAGAVFDFSAFRTLDFLNVDRSKEHSIFGELRQMAMVGDGERSAAAVAHTGTLPRRKRAMPRGQDANAYDMQAFMARAEAVQVRRLLFMNMVENLCAGPKSAIKEAEPGSYYDPEMCRFLGQLLVDRFGGDGLTSHFGWLDWEANERELSPQYLAIARQLDACPLVQDLLQLLADLGFRPSGLCAALPLLKAQFVAALVQLENSAQKQARLHPAHRTRCNQLSALLITADFFPDLLGVCADMVCCGEEAADQDCMTNHECAVLLRDLWDFMQMIIAPSATENGQPTKVEFQLDQNMLNTPEGRQLTATIVNIGQRHIAAMGELLAPLVAMLRQQEPEEDGDNEDSSDFWAHDRLPSRLAPVTAATTGATATEAAASKRNNQLQGA